MPLIAMNREMGSLGVDEYDVGYSTDRVSVDQCVDEILDMVKSHPFQETDGSSHCGVRVTASGGHVVLEGVVDVENRLRTEDAKAYRS